jgi:hypothetical protein
LILAPLICRGTIGELSVASLAELLANGEAAANVQLLDVREEGEHEAASIPGFRLLPLSRSGRSDHADVLCVHATSVKVLQLEVLLAGIVASFLNADIIVRVAQRSAVGCTADEAG